MQYQPKTEDEVMATQLCPIGLQPFTVLESSEGKSNKTGVDMITLKLNVHGDDGFDYHVYDYISPAFMEHKFRHFFYATAMGIDYESGNVNANGNAFQGKQGWADIAHQNGKYGFGPKAIVKDYKDGLPPNVVEAPKAKQAPAKADEKDDVPF